MKLLPRAYVRGMDALPPHTDTFDLSRIPFAQAVVRGKEEDDDGEEEAA